jgi:hypothetical protein
MTLRSLTEITGMGVLNDHLNKPVTAQLLRQPPGLRFVQRHQRRLDRHGTVHAERYGALKGVNRFATTVRIPGKVCFAHTSDQHIKAAPVRDGACKRQEDDIPSRHEGVWQSILRQPYLLLACKGRVRHIGQYAQIEHMVLSQTPAPFRKLTPKLTAERLATDQLDPMSLPVIKSDGFHPLETRQRPREANSGVLSAGQKHER